MPKRRRNTPTQSAAGAKNLARWQAAHRGDSNLQHGVYAALMGGEPPEGLRAKIDEFERSLVRDLGGGDALTAAQRALVQSCRISLTVVTLVDALLLTGPLRACKRRSIAGVLEVVSVHQNALRRNLVALGLERTTADPTRSADAELAAIEREIHEGRR